MNNAPAFTPGMQIHSFVVDRLDPISELNGTLIQLHHPATGARICHFACADSNNLFSVCFRTPPADSTGVAHILEHTVLCGSRRYPVRDPFFNMLKRSLSTFMNAMTASDWTAYPFSSQNRKDFYNLLDVYLDAAFFPLLREEDFRQEGHRLEFATLDDPTTPLMYKGVVYNEMKGAMADPASLLHRTLDSVLYPDTCYRFNSGGDPRDIPKLTWEQLREFHATYYHPSNASFFTYGDLPLEEHLARIEEQVLRHFQRREVDSVVPPSGRFSEPRSETRTFPLNEAEMGDRKAMVQVAWLTGEIDDSFERLAMGLLSSLLLGNPAAPLYKALIDSGLGANLAPATGFHEDNRTTAFAAGLQNTADDAGPAIEKLVLATLAEVAEQGFSRERIEGAIHRLEFAHREVTGDHYPYPLGLLMRILGPWLHGNDPLTPLHLDENLKQLRQRLETEPFFENLIRRHLLDNPHRVCLSLVPDSNQQEREDALVREELDAIAATLNDTDREVLVSRARELQERQEAADDVSSLPTLEVTDIPPYETIPEPEVRPCAGVTVDWFDLPTNGIAYFSASLPVASLPEHLLPYASLFCALLTQIGANGCDYLQMAERIEASTGGVSAGLHILEAAENPDQFRSVLKIKGKGLIRKQEDMFTILGDICTAPDFRDLERLRTLIGQMKTALENSVAGSGHGYAARSAASHLGPTGELRETWSGIRYIQLIKELAGQDQEGLRTLATTMEEIATLLLNSDGLQCSVTAEARWHEQISPPLTAFCQRLGHSERHATPFKVTASPAAGRLGWATSVPVAYVARVFRTVPYDHPDAASLMVLSKLLRSAYLHREIREKGGAYGGMTSCDMEAGTFALLSYRDPHILRTWKVFGDALNWAAAGNFSDSDIREALLSTFSVIDRPISPGSQGNSEFSYRLQGLDAEKRQEMRRRLLAVDRTALQEAARKHLLSEQSRWTDAVIAGDSLLAKAGQELGDELKIERI